MIAPVLISSVTSTLTLAKKKKTLNSVFSLNSVLEINDREEGLLA